ncbi:MAG: M1 family metallopeptidase [Bacteroidota bacterium]
MNNPYYPLACILSVLLLLSPGLLFSQKFSRADSLRGTLSPLRSCYDVTFYDLEVKVNPDLRRIAGSNVFHFRATQPFSRIQIDLFSNMEIERIEYHNKRLTFEREHHAVFIDFPNTIPHGIQDSFKVVYFGTPIEAIRPPWDGGFVWEKDRNGRHWIGVACEGLGASCWWPLKDHLSDEPDSMRISLIFPQDLEVISNGVLRKKTKLAGNFTRSEWFVSYPINSYNVTFYAGDYVHFSQAYVNDTLAYRLDYYVLSYNEEVAKAHFRQVKPMLKTFEDLFGPYPFSRDGFALVESSYWGMEHQGAIAYGNKYRNNDYGFDFIIIHESGHEWFGNSLSANDHAELWIHESFTTYAEALYLEKKDGYETAVKYLLEQKEYIKNKTPIIGPLGVNYNDWVGSDMYYKGSWMLHSLRTAVNNDNLWFRTIKSFALDHMMQQMDSQQVIAYFNEKLGQDYTYLFQQYLRETKLPILAYRIKKKRGNKGTLEYKWVCNTANFRMPVEVTIGKKRMRLTPTPDWQSFPLDNAKQSEVEFDLGKSLFVPRINY